VNTKRPVFLNLWKMKFPITAIVSILHRISGVLIFLSLPILMYLLFRSLHSQTAFTSLQLSMHDWWLKTMLWAIAGAVSFHVLAGLRHLMMDLGAAESLSASRITSYILLALFVVSIILLGVWIW
jgi:succinate dehydrogenase / fumarate reductase, cytochrome b subunit